MSKNRFILIGHGNPLGSYPAPVVPVGRIDHQLVGVYAGEDAPEIVTLDENCSFIEHDEELSAALSQFDYESERLFALSEKNILRYSTKFERHFFTSLLRDSQFSESNPFFRLSLAKRTGVAVAIRNEFTKCSAFVKSIAPGFETTWRMNEQRAISDAGFSWDVSDVSRLPSTSADAWLTTAFKLVPDLSLEKIEVLHRKPSPYQVTVMDISDHKVINDPWQIIDDSTILSPSIEVSKQKDHWEQIVLFPNNKDDDYAIEVELTLLHGETLNKQLYKEAGVILRYAGENQYCYAGLGGFGARTFIGKVSQQENNRVWSCLDSQGKKEEIKVNRPYRLRIECRGNTISLTEDNKNRYTVEIEDYPSSYFGFRTVRTQAQFASVVKTAPSALKVFVIMPFTISLNFVYQTIREVVTEKKFHCQRVDDSSRSIDIVADIKKWLAKADLVIADLTNANPNVYYEVGYADALNKKLILLGQTGTTLGFNISHIRTLFYDDPTDLQRQLRDAIDEQFDS